MESKLLQKQSAVRPRPSLRGTDKAYLRLLDEGARFTREGYESHPQLRVVMPDGTLKVITNAVFYDMLERGLIDFQENQEGKEYFGISEKGRKVLNGEDPYAPAPLPAVAASRKISLDLSDERYDRNGYCTECHALRPLHKWECSYYQSPEVRKNIPPVPRYPGVSGYHMRAKKS